jgi:hypothetical protein
MPSIILKLIEQLNGAVFVLVAILAIAFWSMYKLGGIIKTFNFFEKKNENFDKAIDEMKTNIFSIKATTDLLYQSHLSTIQSHSPISLTPKGITISSELKMEEKVINHWDEIKNEIDKKSPSNPYDIQTISMELAKNCFEHVFNEKEKMEVKSYAYKTGANLLELLPIIGIIVRDKYLKEKGISTEDIDAHAPHVPS